MIYDGLFGVGFDTHIYTPFLLVMQGNKTQIMDSKVVYQALVLTMIRIPSLVSLNRL